MRYGGNTSCVEVRAGERLVILDGGTGLRAFGEELLAKGAPVDADIFFTHLHWDHIQGFPFFGPAFRKGNTFRIHGERRGEDRLKTIMETVLDGQMTDPNFPVPLSIMGSELSFHEIVPGNTLKLGPVTVRTAPMRHPGGAVGYRIEHRDRSFVYATDTEHDAETGILDQEVVALARDADILCYDSTYTEEEYHAGKVGWGHSTFKEALRVARAADVRQLLFFHHDPMHDDKFLDARLAEARVALAGDPSLQVDMAREGVIIRL